MVSKLAKSTIEKLQSEGLNPSVDDIIHLNALGLDVEKGDDMYDFSAVPRVAFINDLVFYEPSIAKRIWIERALSLVSDDFNTYLYLMCFALHFELDELPLLNNSETLSESIATFISNNLMQATTDLLYAVVDYLLYGNNPISGEEYKYSENKPNVTKIPDVIKSATLQLLALATIFGMDYESIKNMTFETLDNMVSVAYIQKGVDIQKNHRLQAAGKFYVTAAKIKERLLKEKENGKE